MSTRFASAFLTAPSTSIGCAATVGSSVGSSFAVQKSACLGLRISVRRRSSAALIDPSETMHRFLTPRHFRLGFDDVDRRQRPDLDLPLVV